MFVKSCLDLICKQLFLPRSLTAVTPPWFSTAPAYPPPPKRGKTAWVLYVSEHFPLLLKENPGTPKSDLFKKLSENYRNLDKSTLDKYQKVADESKKRYQEEIEIYRASLTTEDKLAIAQHKAAVKSHSAEKSKAIQKKQLKELGMPKRPLNAYILFSLDYVKNKLDNGRNAFTDSQKIAAEWNSLPEEQKSKWVEKATNQQKQYKKNMEEWESRMISEGNIEVIHTKPNKSK